MPASSSDVAFSPAVKAVQAARGSRQQYARLEARGGWKNEIDADLAGFIAERTSFYMATASADGQPYVQHRGGPAGFLRVLDARTLAFADFKGNRQYISTGNLTENSRVMLFLMDYQNRRRVKLWGSARVSDDTALMAQLQPEGYGGKPEQAIVIMVNAWDVNCNQHIPQMFAAEDVAAALGHVQARLRDLDAEATTLKARIAELEASLTDR